MINTQVLKLSQSQLDTVHGTVLPQRAAHVLLSLFLGPVKWPVDPKGFSRTLPFKSYLLMPALITMLCSPLTAQKTKTRVRKDDMYSILEHRRLSGAAKASLGACPSCMQFTSNWNASVLDVLAAYLAQKVLAATATWLR